MSENPYESPADVPVATAMEDRLVSFIFFALAAFFLSAILSSIAKRQNAALIAGDKRFHESERKPVYPG